MTRSPDVSAKSLRKVSFVKKNRSVSGSAIVGSAVRFLATMSGIRCQLLASALPGQLDNMWRGLIDGANVLGQVESFIGGYRFTAAAGAEG